MGGIGIPIPPISLPTSPTPPIPPISPTPPILPTPPTPPTLQNFCSKFCFFIKIKKGKISFPLFFILSLHQK